MKKLISIFAILMFVMSSMVIAAPPVPAPIRGYFTINGQGTQGYIVEAKNLRTEEIISGDTIPSMITEPNGFFFDLSKFNSYYGPSWNYVGDSIEVSIRGFTTADSKITFIAEDTPYVITIAISTTDTQYQCADGSIVADLSDCPEVEEEATKVISSEDELSAIVEAYYGQTIKVCIKNNKISTLLDKKIDYDGDDYDIHEEVCFEGTVKTSIDDEDFGLNPYLIIPEGKVNYKYVFEDVIPFAEFHIEEPGEIVFLGQELKIIEATSNSIVLRTGEELTLKEGLSDTILGKKIIAEVIAEHSISVSVGGVTGTVIEGNDKKINGLNVYVEAILYKSCKDCSAVDLIIGTEGDKEIKDGDDFELFIKDDETYKWKIDLPNSIEIISQEAYEELDEDTIPLGIGDRFVLPNDYLEIEFKSVTESYMTEMTFRVDDGYLNVKGEEETFVFGNEEYDEINVNSVGIYDEDEVLITTDKVRIGDSDTFLEMGSVKIGLLTIKLDMSDILYNAISYAAKEESFLDYLGIIFKDPEDGVDEQKGFKVSVPEERPEVTISFNTEVTEVPIEPPVTPPVEPPVVEPPVVTPPITPPTPPPVTPPTPPPVTPPVEPPVEPEPSNNLVTLILGMIASILVIFGWGKGFAGLIKYYLKKSEEAQKAGDLELAKKYQDRATKMAKTVLTNFMAGKYKK